MTESSEHSVASPKKRMELDLGKQALLVLFLVWVLGLIGLSLWASAAVYWRFADDVSTPGQWTLLVLVCTLVFCYSYMILLLILRLVIPKPKEGFFPQDSGRPSREVLLLMLNVLLTKLRYSPPWNHLFTGVLVRLPPFKTIFQHLFGPHTRNMTLGDTIKALDPYLLYAGRNVQFGYDVGVTCHVFDNRGMTIKRVVVDDYAVIGGGSWLLAGVHVGHHSVVASCSMVKPNTRIGPYELWGGVPARKIRDLPRDDEPEAGAEVEGPAPLDNQR